MILRLKELLHSDDHVTHCVCRLGSG